jgi:hypothetical protein
MDFIVLRNYKNYKIKIYAHDDDAPLYCSVFQVCLHVLHMYTNFKLVSSYLIYKTVHGASSAVFVSHATFGHFIDLMRGSVGSKCVYSFTTFVKRTSVCLKYVFDTHIVESVFFSSLPQFLHL